MTWPNRVVRRRDTASGRTVAMAVAAAPRTITPEEQAVAHGRSAEAEHRSILEAALGLRERPSFLEVLASIPDVGTDADFERIQSTTAAKSHVFD